MWSSPTEHILCDLKRLRFSFVCGVTGLICPCSPPVFVICKLGNDSQKAVQVVEKMSGSEVDGVTVKDVCGGLMAWAKTVDPTFPRY